MCRLTLQLQQMSNDVQGDAIVVQPKHCGEGSVDYLQATAIIRRVNSPHGAQWSFNNIMNVNGTPLPCSGTVGDVAIVTSSAYYQFGEKLLHADLISVSYKDSNFPQSLIP